MAEAPHGTAPALYGKNVANPMAMILAGASLLTYLPDPGAAAAARAIYEAVFEAVADGLKTADLGGHATTTAFTDEVIRRVGSKLEVWATLGE
jgi:isocitrate/isopropylmalate dehydrogenase